MNNKPKAARGKSTVQRLEANSDRTVLTTRPNRRPQGSWKGSRVCGFGQGQRWHSVTITWNSRCVQGRGRLASVVAVDLTLELRSCWEQSMYKNLVYVKRNVE
ncbi:hypothetical protein EVAR_5487_1 [Eumeta japonica]|uniref:Uncharacterized protein n=1 Tax=Eumeta variegata TaxID=151549 RepID=A0A4C1T9V7_EUMVA|nr:hypothetical protein EVAR_5487_1 [Eumeta japonica]